VEDDGVSDGRTNLRERPKQESYSGRGRLWRWGVFGLRRPLPLSWSFATLSSWQLTLYAFSGGKPLMGSTWEEWR
jgi:hypothetical protein